MTNSTKAIEALFRRTAEGIKPGLETITALLAGLGNPHQKLAVIHVAGTNGKGSVCAMLESVLRASGFRTGLYTSPHLVDFAERFRINGIVIDQPQLDRYIEKIDAAATALPGRPATFFEISTAIAFNYFADEKVDIAVIETGMGGRWDATNVVIPLISVITAIDIDHTHYLGNTLASIASEKAGIIKPGRPVVSAPQPDEAMAELKKAGEPIIVSTDAISICRTGAPQTLKIETPARTLPSIKLPLLGACQRENCAVAVATLEVLADLIDFEPAYKKGLNSVGWSARTEIIHTDPLIILDGAHNPSGARALVKTLKEVWPERQVGFILGFLGDKDAIEFLRAIKPSVAIAWTIPITDPRGASAEASAAKAAAAGLAAEPLAVEEAWQVAQNWAAEPDRMICIAGSLRLKQTLVEHGCR